VLSLASLQIVVFLSKNIIYIHIDGLVKSRQILFSVIPAKAGIQCFQRLITDLDPGFRRGDDFLRVHQL